MSGCHQETPCYVQQISFRSPIKIESPIEIPTFEEPTPSRDFIWLFRLTWNVENGDFQLKKLPSRSVVKNLLGVGR